MRSNRPVFNLPSRLAINAAIQAHATAADTLFASGFEWQHLPLHGCPVVALCFRGCELVRTLFAASA